MPPDPLSMNSNSPYRASASVEKYDIPYTDDEVSLWDCVYKGCLGRGMSAEEKASSADNAITERRKRFGVR